MRRRDVLQSSVGALALAGLGGVAGASSDAATYAPKGEVSIDGTTEVATTPDGQFAAVAKSDGFAMVDVSDPATPTVAYEGVDLLSDAENGPMRMVKDVKIDGDRLLVVGPNQPPRQGKLVKAALLYDVSDPANPEQLDVLKVDHAIHNSFFTDGYAYLTVSDFEYEGFKIVDASGDELEVRTKWSIVDHDEKWKQVHGYLRSCHDLYVQDDVAYLAQWDAGSFMVDVSDKQNPTVLGRAGGLPAAKLAKVTRDNLGTVGIEPPGNAHYVRPSEDGNYLYKGAESWDMTTENGKRGASGITVFDISDVANPKELTTIHPPGASDESFQGNYTTSHNFSLRGDKLFSSWYYGGVMVHDVSDPANPKRLSWWRKPGEAEFWGAKVAGDRDFFVAGNYLKDHGALMTFPTSAGEMESPPDAFTPPEETNVVTSIDWEQYTASEKTTTTTTNGTTTNTTTTDVTTTEPMESTTDGSTTGMETTADATATEKETDGSPGFGALAAAGGIGLGAARLLADSEPAADDEE